VVGDKVDCIEDWLHSRNVADMDKKSGDGSGNSRRYVDIGFRVCGARKVWRQLLREGVGVARCTIERLMKKLEIQGARRGRKCFGRPLRMIRSIGQTARSTGNLRQPGQINCEWQTSHVLQHGRDLFMRLL